MKTKTSDKTKAKSSISIAFFYSFAAFLLSIILFSVISILLYRKDIEESDKLADLYTHLYSDQIRIEFQQGVFITETMEELVRNSPEGIEDFDQRSRQGSDCKLRNPS